MVSRQCRKWCDENLSREERTRRRVRETRLQYAYGLGWDDYIQLLENQDWRCRICGATLRDDRQTHVDHDHITGEVRGVLCFHCNVGLGYFRDNANLLRRAAQYLEE